MALPRTRRRRRLTRGLLAAALLALLLLPAGVRGADPVDEIHYTFTGATSVAFDWRGSATDIRYGLTTAYGQTATAQPSDPTPVSSAGPFEEVGLTGLQAGTTYHYSIGGGDDHTFETAPTGPFRFDVEADVGSSRDFSNVAPTQAQIAADDPDFVLVPGDLSYATPFGQPSVDQHFDDVMAWSLGAAYMPAWGNHEWESPNTDDLRNYKGRFMLPHPQAMPSAPALGCCGEDWSWFDAGGVRFISYPEPYASVTWDRWEAAADPIFADAQADPSIHFIVTYGHRPAYSTGFHTGETSLATVLNHFGDTYSKYQLNINGHSHDYERFQPIHGVTHVTTGGGGAALEPPWSATDERTAFRAMHLQHLRVDVTADGMRIQAICGPPTSQDDTSCIQGTVIDSFTLGTNPPPPPPPPPTLYVDNTNPNCMDKGAGTQTQPYCTINAAASVATAGQTVQVGNGTYPQEVHPAHSGTAAAPINYINAPGTKPTLVGGTGATSGGFYVLSQSYITIQGFTIDNTNGDGIALKTSSNITVRGNTVLNAGQPISGKTAKGIRIDGSTDCVVANNKLHDNTNNGIYVLAGSTRNVISGNEVYANAAQYDRIAAGIRVYQSSGNTITGNVSHDNEDSGIEFFNTATNNLVTDNITYGNGDHGIDNNNSGGQTIVGNTVYGNLTAGINAEGTSPNTTIRNNISSDNGVNSPRTRSNIRVDSTSTSGSSVDYDLVFLSAPGTMMIWGSTSYSSLTAFVASTGKETHGIQGNPRWTDPAAGDFTLGDNSPAIDSADSGAAGQPKIDAHENPRLDDPSVPNTGAGPRRYDDRGALEHQLDEVIDQPPNVVLTASPTGGSVPLAVTADASDSTDTDATPIDTYKFDFGDGTVTGNQSAATAGHTYRTPGTYTLKVTVTDHGGLSSSATTQIRVTAPADAPPSAVLTASPAAGPAPLQVTADGSDSSDTDSTPIDTYRFDFGDGSDPVGPQSGATATHTYDTPGTYTVTMTVTDTAGLASSATTQVTVRQPVDAPPAATLTLSPSSGLAPLAVTADASGSTDTDATPIATYDFDFGDGTVTGPQADPTATHTYLLEGTYTVTVTVKDTAGLSSTATRQVAVTPDTPPTAALSVSPSSGNAPLDVTADASGSTDPDPNGISSYSFDFGDGSAPVTQATATATHRYTAMGTFTVTVTVSDPSGKSSTASAQVTVRQPDRPPSATIVVNPSTGAAPVDVTADASGSSDTDATPIASYKFTFGDGSAAVGPQPGATATHTYTASGTYTVTVTVTDTGGLSTTASTQVTVSDRDFPPSAALTATPSSGVTPLAMTADASGSTDADSTPIATYRFEWGDGSPATGPQSSPTATHTYGPPGSYTAKVTVTDTAGLTSTATVSVRTFANFVGNSGFETDLSGWNTSGGGANIALTRVSGGHTGSWAAKLTNSGGTASTALINDSPDWAKPTQAGTYTGSLWVRADTAGAKLNLRFREYSGSTLLKTDTTTVTLSTAWQLVSVSHTTVSPGSTLDFNAYVSSAAAGSSWYADDAAVFLSG
jgi:parallel beta-helix repeat protein